MEKEVIHWYRQKKKKKDKDNLGFTVEKVFHRNLRYVYLSILYVIRTAQMNVS